MTGLLPTGRGFGQVRILTTGTLVDLPVVPVDFFHAHVPTCAVDAQEALLRLLCVPLGVLSEPAAAVPVCVVTQVALLGLVPVGRSLLHHQLVNFKLQLFTFNLHFIYQRQSGGARDLAALGAGAMSLPRFVRPTGPCCGVARAGGVE